ncbi:winged helix-turn-helix domain-containing protein [Vibrio sp. TRT 17S01]|uniref:winged helix-turn-helix domain-containing protein n=1 Tax=Vibrio sp. TRT 17S01 TaxID=3418505 RepID=UPI003CF68BDA
MLKLVKNRQELQFTDSENIIKQVPLNLVEYNVLKMLSDAYPKTCDREQLMTCWEGRVVTQSSLNVLINNIRKHIRGFTPDEVVMTSRGKGYYLAEKIEEIEIKTPILPSSESTSLPSSQFHRDKVANIFQNKFTYLNLVLLVIQFLIIAKYWQVFQL